MLQVRTFEYLAGNEALSAISLASHLKLYAGYVHKYNELIEKFHTIQRRGPGAGADVGSVKGDLTFALSAVKNHELYFDALATPTAPEPAGALADLIVKSFHSIPQYLVDLKQTAQHGRGWVWTAYDLDLQRLFNFEAGAGGGAGLPVWNTVPLLAIDLFGHAYFYDYGNNRTAYIEAVMKSLNWTVVAQRLQRIINSADASPAGANAGLE